MSKTDLTYSVNKEYVTLQVWLPGTFAGIHTPTLTLENPWGMRFFLEALSQGHSLYGMNPFDVVAYQGRRLIGQGTYIVTFPPEDSHEPIRLDTISETGEIAGILQVAWQEMAQAIGLNDDDEEGNKQ